MDIINVKKAELNKRGINDFTEWSKNPESLYIGRNMEVYVAGTKGSVWANPFPVKKYGLDQCLVLYEEMVRTTDLWNKLETLENKELGCWCKPDKCHVDILIKLLNEKTNKKL
jgi:hypothetical protein